jgi:hypothetical protein
MSYDDIDLYRLLRQINDDTERFEKPREGFDPLNPQPGELEAVGLPPMPDPTTEPEVYEFWKQLVAPPLSFPDVEFEYPPIVAQNIQSAGAVSTSTRYQGSLNWSGASITPRDGRQFVEILGAWKVPTVSVPPGGSAGAEYGSSTWIGFDGQRRYRDSTLPQIGTGQFLNVGGVSGPTTISWIQWWPGPPLTLTSLPVHPGNTILCWLTVVNQTQIILRIKNASTMSGPFLPFLWTAPMVPLAPPPPQTQALVSGATAEWVMERPAKWPTPDLFELPYYNGVEFTGALGRTAHAPGLSMRTETLFGCRLIRMYRVAENPHRAVTVSVAKRLGAHAVRTTYRT